LSALAITEAEKDALATSRTGVGLLNAMFRRLYCSELAHHNELIHKVSISLTALFATSACASVITSLSPKAAPFLTCTSAIVSVLGTAFAWRNTSLTFVKASAAYADQEVRWRDLWEQARTGTAPDSQLIANLEREANKTSESIAPHRRRTRLARRCQDMIKTQVGLPTKGT